MTNSEAIEVLNMIETHGPLPTMAKAKSIEALEKQIPKKPHKNFEKFSGVWCSCGKYLGKGYFIDKPSYCPDCGQKLDWSDNNDK